MINFEDKVFLYGRNRGSIIKRMRARVTKKIDMIKNNKKFFFINTI